LAIATIHPAIGEWVGSIEAFNSQSCIATKRFIVADEIADRFEQALAEKMRALELGDPFEVQTEIGPLATADTVVSLQRDVQKNVDAGEKVSTRGRPAELPGNFYLPTVRTEIPHNSPADREELFGPVASLVRVKNLDEAIGVTNDRRFGLGASAWTNDRNEQERSIDKLEQG